MKRRKKFGDNITNRILKFTKFMEETTIIYAKTQNIQKKKKYILRQNTESI